MPEEGKATTGKTSNSPFWNMSAISRKVLLICSGKWGRLGTVRHGRLMHLWFCRTGLKIGDLSREGEVKFNAS